MEFSQSIELKSFKNIFYISDLFVCFCGQSIILVSLKQYSPQLSLMTGIGFNLFSLLWIIFSLNFSDLCIVICGNMLAFVNELQNQLALVHSMLGSTMVELCFSARTFHNYGWPVILYKGTNYTLWQLLNFVWMVSRQGGMPKVFIIVLLWGWKYLIYFSLYCLIFSYS